MAVTEGVQDNSREVAVAARERVETGHQEVEAIAPQNHEPQPTTSEDGGPAFDPATQTAAQEHAIQASFAEQRSTDPLNASWQLAGSPAPASPAPLDQALGELQQAEESLQSMQDLAAEGNGAARAELQGGYLQSNVHTAEAAVETAVADEIAQEAGTTDPGVAAIDRVGNEIAERYAGDPAAETAVHEAVGEVQLDAQVDDVLDAAEAVATPQEAIETLGEQYAAAAPEVQARLRTDSRTGALLDQAVEEANAPLESIPGEIRSGHDVYPPVREALHNLE